MNPKLWLPFLLLPFYLSAQIKVGLAAKYSFNNGTAEDDLGLNHPKAYGAKFTEDRFGNNNAAIYLQGNPDSYIRLGSSSTLKPVKGTVSLWVKINQPILKGSGLTHNPIIRTRAHADEDFDEAFYIGYHLDLKNINVNTSYSEQEVVTLYPTKETSLLEWHHVVMTFDNKFLSFYLDGVLENKAAKIFNTRYLEGDSILVGKISSSKNQRSLNACVDDIEIYNRVLSPAEVTELFNAPNPNKLTIIAKWIFFCLILLSAIVIAIWLVRRRIASVLKTEMEKNQLQNKWYEQENRVLSAQMDPHFIFNSLNTIQQFIITNDNEKAQLYLSKFSRLMRKILESNTNENITLVEEIDIFQKYLEIESLRFNNVFNYSINVDSGIKLQEIKIPHFLIQPLIENAIWHGLLPKEGEKELSISFKQVDDNLLSCTIDDNGIGRKNSMTREKSAKKQSFAINFIEQRLSLLSKLTGVDCGIRIIDKIGKNNESAGTMVIVTIPIISKEK